MTRDWIPVVSLAIVVTWKVERFTRFTAGFKPQASPPMRRLPLVTSRDISKTFIPKLTLTGFPRLWTVPSEGPESDAGPWASVISRIVVGPVPCATYALNPVELGMSPLEAAIVIAWRLPRPFTTTEVVPLVWS